PAIVPMPLGNPGAVNLKGLRIALHTDNGVLGPTPETVATVRTAAKALSDGGTLVEEARPEGIGQIYELALALYFADGGAAIRRLLQEAGTTEHTLPWLSAAQPVSTTQLDALVTKWYRVRSTMLSFLKDYDVILCPANAFAALSHGAVGEDLQAFS